MLWLIAILINGTLTFGWCSTEKPASFTQPSHGWDRVSTFGFVPFYLSEVIPLATVSVRVPFLFPLLPVCFSSPANMHSTEGTRSSNCNASCLDWVVSLCSVINNYSLKPLVFVQFILNGCQNSSNGERCTVLSA